jgi:hypothetical protein
MAAVAMKALSILTILALLGMSAGRGAESVVVADLIITSLVIMPTSVTLTALDEGVGATGYLVQSSPSLEAPAWEQEGGIFAGGGAGAHALTFARGGLGKRFYRVLGISSTASDSDGDGLSDTFEQSIGSNRFKFDTDGDGVSDGDEYAYGTNPLNAGERPVFTNLPRAEFAVSNSTALEGAPSHSVRIVFDKPFNGLLKVQTLSMSTAAALVDYEPFSQSIAVSGTEAFVTIAVIDNLAISGARAIQLQIVTDPAQPYARGARTRHTVIIAENDSWWTGSVTDTYAERNFRLRILRNASGSQMVFGAGAGRDGLAMLASEAPAARTSLSKGLVPDGEWNATVVSDLPHRLHLSSPAMPADGGGLLSGAGALTRRIEFQCQPTVTGEFAFHELRTDRIIGSYREVLSAAAGSYLGVTNSGGFVLVRDIPTTAKVTNPLATP